MKQKFFLASTVIILWLIMAHSSVVNSKASYKSSLPSLEKNNFVIKALKSEIKLSCIDLEKCYSLWYYFETAEAGYIVAEFTGFKNNIALAAVQVTNKGLKEIFCHNNLAKGKTAKAVFPVLADQAYCLIIGFYNDKDVEQLDCKINLKESPPED